MPLPRSFTDPARRVREAADPLAVVSGLATRLRRSSKPLHPRGCVLEGVLTRSGSVRRSGVPWLDEHGTDTVLVRRSRGGGLPHLLPDVEGLAVRIPVGDGHADLLLSSAGLGPVSRFVPLPSRRHGTRPLSTLMPYRGPHGAVLVAARPDGTDTMTLLWATPRSDWVPFGRLVLSEDGSRDAEVSFDSFAFPLPGLGTFAWTRRLREPAYRAARAHSGRSLDGSGEASRPHRAGTGLVD